MTYSPNSLDQTRSKCSNKNANSDINLEIYSAGFIDGLGGLNAELPHFEDYWDGYCVGYREYCCGLLGEEIPAPQKIRASAVHALTS